MKMPIIKVEISQGVKYFYNLALIAACIPIMFVYLQLKFFTVRWNLRFWSLLLWILLNKPYLLPEKLRTKKQIKIYIRSINRQMDNELRWSSEFKKSTLTFFRKKAFKL